MTNEADENRALLNAPALGTLMAIRETVDRIEFVVTTASLFALGLIALFAFLVAKKSG